MVPLHVIWYKQPPTSYREVPACGTINCTWIIDRRSFAPYGGDDARIRIEASRLYRVPMNPSRARVQKSKRFSLRWVAPDTSSIVTLAMPSRADSFRRNGLSTQACGLIFLISCKRTPRLCIRFRVRCTHYRCSSHRVQDLHLRLNRRKRRVGRSKHAVTPKRRCWARYNRRAQRHGLYHQFRAGAGALPLPDPYSPYHLPEYRP